jgi:hypothetical protein
MATARTPAAARFQLTLDGVACGLTPSVSGGDVSADVVAESADASYFVKKHIGAPKYEDFSAEIDFGFGHDVWDWIANSFRQNYARKDGSVTTVDVDLNAKVERQFFNALLVEVAFPALDGASKEPGKVTIKFSPELTRSHAASGKVSAGPAKAKRWLASNFKLELDGVDCTRVKRIDSFAVQLPVSADAVGSARDLQKEPGRIDFPNLRVTIAEGSSIASWKAWFEDFVINGNNDESKEKNGAIVLLTPDLKTELARVVLHNVGIFALRRGQQAEVADLYCERMDFQMPGLKLPPPAERIIRQPTLPIR